MYYKPIVNVKWLNLDAFFLSEGYVMLNFRSAIQNMSIISKGSANKNFL